METKGPMHTDKGNTPSSFPRDSLEGMRRQISRAKPLSGKQVSSALESGKIMTFAPKQALTEQKLIEINTPKDISTWWNELINSLVQPESLP